MGYFPFEDPLVDAALLRLKELEPLSSDFNALKDALKDYVLSNYAEDGRSWEEDWEVETTVFNYVLGKEVEA